VNPAAKVDNIRRPQDAVIAGQHGRDDQLEAVLELATPWPRAAIAIAAYTGMRESDLARVTWKRYSGGEFETPRVKTGQPIWVGAHYRLRETLDPAHRINPRIVAGVRGWPIRQHARVAVLRLPRVFAAQHGRTGDQLSRAAPKLDMRLAEAGFDAPTIASVFGERMIQMVEHYFRTARGTIFRQPGSGGPRKGIKTKMENLLETGR
jgi:integrase